jgi:hypothetical protein
MPSCPGLNAWILVLSRPLLCLDQSGHEDVEVGWVDVADGDDAQVWVWCCVEGEACAGGVRTLLFLHVRSALKNREWQRRRTCPHWRFPLLDSLVA